MYQILAERESLNLIASRVNGRTPGVFSEISLALPPTRPAELGFIRAVSWLYVLYYEAGKTGTKFLADKVGVFCVHHVGTEDHYYLVGNLRTYLQHNLVASKPHDLHIQGRCEQWFLRECGSRIPGSEAHWQKCLAALLRAALGFLKALVATVRAVEGDESRQAIVEEWGYALDRYHAPYEFDDLIVIACREMGRDAIDATELRRRYYERWTKELQFMNKQYDFHVEARKLIEHTLLAETTTVLPITGADIIQAFSIQPGPQVGELLRTARVLYDQRPCSSEELLRRLQAYNSEGHREGASAAGPL